MEDLAAYFVNNAIRRTAENSSGTRGITIQTIPHQFW